MRPIPEIQEDLYQVNMTLRPLLETKRDLEVELMWAKSPLQAGDVIEWGSPKGRRKGTIIGAHRWGEKCSWMVRFIRTDGTDGSVVNVYPYHEPQKVG